jgi:hypothetical protein
MAGKNQTSSTTKNQGGHRKSKNKASKQEQKLAQESHAVGRKKRQPNLGDITRSEKNA